MCAGMDKPAAFRLERQSDDLVYHFDLQDCGGYLRRDRPIWIRFRPTHGWCAWGPEGLSGRPWEADPFAPAPPEGVWLSRKGAKSYVYNLIHSNDQK